MLGKGAHVQHDKFRLPKNLPVDALKDEVFVCLGIQGYQEGVIDIAISMLSDVHDLGGWFELVGSGNKVVQGLVSCIEISSHMRTDLLFELVISPP